MTWFRVGGAGIPTSLKNAMNAVLNKKFGTSGQNYPPNGWPDDVNLLGPLPEKTVSGSIVNFADGSDDVPIKSGIFDIEYNENGVASMTITKTAKNLIKLSAESASSAQRCSVIYTNSGAEVTAEGTYARSGCLFAVKTGVTYTVSFTGKSTGDYNRVALNDKDGWSSPFKYLNLTSTETQYTWTFTASTDILFFGMYVTGGGTTGTMTISNLQLEVGSSSSTYEPFNAVSFPISFGQTIYGGYFISDTGILTITKDSSGADLPSPVVVPLDALEMSTVYSVNNFYSDRGPASITYRADIDLLLAALQNSRSLSASLMRSAGPDLEERSEDPEEVSELEENIQNTEEQEGEDDAR